jgi:hypothetical protein
MAIVAGYYKARGDPLICGAANSIAVRFLNSGASEWDAAGCTRRRELRRMVENLRIYGRNQENSKTRRRTLRFEESFTVCRLRNCLFPKHPQVVGSRRSASLAVEASLLCPGQRCVAWRLLRYQRHLDPPPIQAFGPPNSSPPAPIARRPLNQTSP